MRACRYRWHNVGGFIMFYVYDRYNIPLSAHHLNQYRTVSAARAAITRTSKASGLLPTDNLYPQYRLAIAETGYYHQTIERTRGYNA